MCEQCLTDPIYFGEPLTGYVLARARRDCPWADWKIGEWGLIEVNDPTYRWRRTPTPSPVWGMDDDATDAYIGSLSKEDPNRNRWVNGPGAGFEDAFQDASLMGGYKLVKACMEKGYDPKLHGTAVLHWLFDYLGEWLKTAEEETDPADERMVVRDKDGEPIPTDETIGRHPIEGELEGLGSGYDPS